MRYCRVLTLWAVLGLLFASVAEETSASSDKEPIKELNIYNWEDYFGEETLPEFTRKYGVKVNLDTFTDEQKLFASITSNPAKYDIIVTSGASIIELKAARLLARIDLKNVPNFKNIDPKFRNPHYDPQHEHSVPYLWGTTGIVVNRKFVKDEGKSWSILWNPQYRGKIAMLSSPEEVLGSALKYLGHPLNTSDPSHFQQARQKLLEQSPLVVDYFDPIAVREKMVSSALWAAQIYSGEGMSAVDKNEDLEFFIPREGTAVWVDCLAIPRDAKNRHTAERFINYILEPAVSAEIANYLWYANCNKAARPLTNPEILESPSLYPPEDVLKKCEFFHPQSVPDEQRAYEKALNTTWTELKLRKKKPLAGK